MMTNEAISPPRRKKWNVCGLDRHTCAHGHARHVVSARTSARTKRRPPRGISGALAPYFFLTATSLLSLQSIFIGLPSLSFPATARRGNMYACMHAGMQVCMYVCTRYKHKHTHTHTHTPVIRDLLGKHTHTLCLSVCLSVSVSVSVFVSVSVSVSVFVSV